MYCYMNLGYGLQFVSEIRELSENQKFAIREVAISNMKLLNAMKTVERSERTWLVEIKVEIRD